MVKGQLISYILQGDWRKVIEYPTQTKISVKFIDQIDSEEFKENQEELDNPIQVVQLEFGLPKSCYATMVLREFLCNELDLKEQRNLADQFKVKN